MAFYARAAIAAFTMNFSGSVTDDHQKLRQLVWLLIKDSSIIYSRKLCFQMLSEKMAYLCQKTRDLTHSRC